MAKLCAKGKAAAKRKFKVYPSAYANMYGSAVCSGKVTPGGKKKRKKAMGGRIGRRLGGGADMAKRKTNVQKIKETFGPKKNVPNKFKGFSKLPEAVQQKINKKLAKKV